MTIETKLSKLATTKSDIKQAMIDKGMTVPTGTTFREYANIIMTHSCGTGKTNNLVLDFFGDGSGLVNLPLMTDIGSASLQYGTTPSFDTDTIHGGVLLNGPVLSMNVPNAVLSGEFTMSMFLSKPFGGNNMIVTTYPDGNGVYGIYQSSMYVGTPSSPPVFPGTFRYMERTHVVIVSELNDGGTGYVHRAYVDGVYFPHGAINYFGTPNTANKLYIGGASDGGFVANITMDNFRLFNRSVTASEVEQLYQDAPRP